MYFRNEHHRQAFREGMKKKNRKDKETVSAVYLLSAEPCLWRRAKQASVYGKILLNKMKSRKSKKRQKTSDFAQKSTKSDKKWLG